MKKEIIRINLWYSLFYGLASIIMYQFMKIPIIGIVLMLSALGLIDFLLLYLMFFALIKAAMRTGTKLVGIIAKVKGML